MVKVGADGDEEWQRRIGASDEFDVGFEVSEADDGFVLGVGLAVDGGQKPGCG